MTFGEAEERAALIWFNVSRVVRLRVKPELWEVDAANTAGRGIVAHFMDANGHPTCHPECMAREERLGILDAS